ncbi:MAG: carbohydrate porin [Puia sp.]
MQLKLYCPVTFALLYLAVSAQNQTITAKPTENSQLLEPAAVAIADARKFNFHFQTTYIYQYKPAFYSPYSAAHSLLGMEEKQNSLTATLYAGMKLWKGAEIYINPEIAGGSGLSGAFGLAASTNGETYRVGDPSPTLYLARLFLRQTIALGAESSGVEDGANQISCQLPYKYIQFLLGKYCLGDIFDNNVYSNSPRAQFMNWAIMNNAAWDYASNVRGYNYAFTTILRLSEYILKASVSLMPTVPNGTILNTNLREEYAINGEAGKTYKIGNKPGNIRLLGYYNYAGMGNYKQAITTLDSDGVPDIAATRSAGRHKIGFGINADQQISETVGLFGRIGWDDGKTETWCYTESDRTLSAGISINGKRWKRKDDQIGFALVTDGLSSAHRNYLASGGFGFELGDRKLNYGHETATELYYSLKPASIPIWLSADYQFVMNPGYNKDRGPVNVFSFRLHLEL